jgi:hypothetical protein
MVSNARAPAVVPLRNEFRGRQTRRAESPRSITAAQLAEWRAQLPEDGDHLDPTLAQVIFPQLMDDVERLQAELAYVCRKFAALEVGGARRLALPQGSPSVPELTTG